MQKWVLFLLILFTAASGSVLLEPSVWQSMAQEKTEGMADSAGEDEDDSRTIPGFLTIHVEHVLTGPLFAFKLCMLPERSQDVFAPPPELRPLC